MRKLFIGMISLLYLSTSAGIALNIHYCMNRIASVSLYHGEAEEDGCGTCGMSKTDNHCCKDETKLVKLSDDHQPVKSFLSAFFTPAIIASVTYQYRFDWNEERIMAKLQYRPPPPKEFNQVYLSCAVLLI